MNYKKVLADYRLKQAQDTLRDAEAMLKSKLSSQSIINRAYYAMFYAVLALFIKNNIDLKTSKHAGVIAIFDKEFVHTGKFAKKYSKILHKAFEIRQEGDYKELVVFTQGDAGELVALAKEFLSHIR